jgi:hypothetical protein
MRVLVKVYEAANDEGEDNGDKDYNLRHTARSRSEFPIASGLMAESIGDLAGGTDQPSISASVLRTSEVRLLA